MPAKNYRNARKSPQPGPSSQPYIEEEYSSPRPIAKPRQIRTIRPNGNAFETPRRADHPLDSNFEDNLDISVDSTDSRIRHVRRQHAPPANRPAFASKRKREAEIDSNEYAFVESQSKRNKEENHDTEGNKFNPTAVYYPNGPKNCRNPVNFRTMDGINYKAKYFQAQRELKEMTRSRDREIKKRQNLEENLSEEPWKLIATTLYANQIYMGRMNEISVAKIISAHKLDEYFSNQLYHIKDRNAGIYLPSKHRIDGGELDRWLRGEDVNFTRHHWDRVSKYDVVQNAEGKKMLKRVVLEEEKKQQDETIGDGKVGKNSTMEGEKEN